MLFISCKQHFAQHPDSGPGSGIGRGTQRSRSFTDTQGGLVLFQTAETVPAVGHLVPHSRCTAVISLKSLQLMAQRLQHTGKCTRFTLESLKAI